MIISVAIAIYVLAVVGANLNPEQQSPYTTLTDRLFWYPGEMVFAIVGPAIVPVSALLIPVAIVYLWFVL